MCHSDSDPTECISELDTGQDGGDECDTDELLDIDFIDNGSIQEIIDKNLYENKGSCSYVSNQSMEKRLSRLRKSKKPQEDMERNGSRRRKRLTRTRKSSRDCRDNNANHNSSICSESPLKRSQERGTKSVGGTPLSLRKNKADQEKT